MLKLTLIALLASTSVASAAPRHKPETTEIRTAKEQSAAAKAELKAAKAKAKAANHKLKLAKAKAAQDKAAKRLAREQWIDDCIDERTGPAKDGGISEDEATEICEAEAE
jgi:hypothetical protein